jgi:hypothetical protein
VELTNEWAQSRIWSGQVGQIRRQALAFAVSCIEPARVAGEPEIGLQIEADGRRTWALSRDLRRHRRCSGSGRTARGQGH